MKLHSHEFEKRLRRGLKEARRQSRDLRIEMRRANRFRRHYKSTAFLRSLLSVFAGLVTWWCVAETRHLATGLAFLSLWTFVWVFIRASGLRQTLFRASDLPALSVLPVSGAFVFRWQLWKFFRSSWCALLDWLAGLLALAFYYSFSPWKYPAVIAIAVFGWLTQLSLTALCAARIPRAAAIGTAGGWTIGFALIVSWRFVATTLLKALDSVAPTLTLLLPTGWPLGLFGLLTHTSLWLALVMFVLTLVLLWASKDSLARLKAGYEFNEIVQQEPHDLLPEDFVPETIGQTIGDPARPRKVGPTELEELVITRRFLRPADWTRRGWIERMLWTRLACRERTLAEFAFPDGLNLTTGWRKVGRNFAVMLAAGYLAGALSPATQMWVLGAGLFITTCQALALIYASGKAFAPMNCSGVNIPLYAVHPVGYRELAWVLFKCTLAQGPVLSVFCIAACMVGCYLAGQMVLLGLVFGLKAVVILTTARFPLVSLSFSSVTNDTSDVRLRSILPLGLILAGGFLFIGLGVAGMLVAQPVLAWSLIALTVLAAYGFFGLYGWRFHANRFDLMSLPKQNF